MLLLTNMKGVFIIDQFTNEYSNFPQKLITLHHFKDADDSIASLINEINSLKSRGLYDLAEKLQSENKSILTPYNIDSDTINTLDEEIQNGQIMAIQKSQVIFTDFSEPEICCINDIWMGV